MELKEIIKQVKEASQENQLYPSHDIILDCATRIFNNSHIRGKDKGLPYSRPPSPDIPATEGQKKALLKHGYKGDVNNLTKKEAMQLIKEGVGQ